jgi:hypothetical protein
VAYLAAMFYAFHPVLLLNGRRAIMEGSFLAFSLLTVLAAVWWLKIATPYSPTPALTQAGRGGISRIHKAWLAAILLGIAAGLALASKHTAVFTVAAVFGACGLWILIEQARRYLSPSPVPFPEFREGQNTRMPSGVNPFPNSGRDLGWGKFVQLAADAIVALSIFYILNPAWWGDPVTRAGQVLERRQELLNEQVTFFGGYTDVADSFAGFLRQSLVAQPQYFEAPGWENYIGDQIVRYEASPLQGVTIGGSVVGAVILGGLVLVGFWALLRDSIIPTSIRWLIGIWTLALIVTTMLLTPIEWQRYYLPVYPVIGLLAAMGLWWGLRMIIRLRYPRV